MDNFEKLDPDWKKAEIHGLANRAGVPVTDPLFDSQSLQNSTQDKGTTGLICKCCYEHVNKTPISLWENSK